MTAPSPPLISRYHVGILGLQPRDKAAMLGVRKKELFSRRIYMKIEVTSQRREMLLFLTTKMAAVTSPANQKYKESLFNVSKNKKPLYASKLLLNWPSNLTYIIIPQ